MTDARCSGAIVETCSGSVETVTIDTTPRLVLPMCQACRDGAGRIGLLDRRATPRPVDESVQPSSGSIVRRTIRELLARLPAGVGPMTFDDVDEEV